MHPSTSFVAAILSAAAMAAPLDDSTIRDLSGLEDRQINPPVCTDETKVEKVGGGNPKTWWLQKQVTREQICGQRGCEISSSEATSYTVEWSASISSPYGFITGGFAVSKTTETGEINTCAGEAGDRLCAYVALKHTEFDVQEWTKKTCGKKWEKKGDQYRITAPNNDGDNKPRCVYKTCRKDGDQYWSKDMLGNEV